MDLTERVNVTARDGTRLAVHDSGSGPGVLCVPGGPGRASAYLENLGGLDATHTLHLLDSRGSGDSELPGDRGSLPSRGSPTTWRTFGSR